MFFDGSYTLKGVGTGVVRIPPKGDTFKYVIQLNFPTTNNVVKYDGFVISMRLTKELGIL
jgi:hypothetical protein